MAEKKYKIIVVSDSHGNNGDLEKLIPLINSSDYFVFLGDGNRDIERIIDKITTQVIRVKGNCDLTYEISDEALFELGDARFFATHGNKYGVKSSLISLAQHAREIGCYYALYGHTHRAGVSDAGGVTLVNPGALERGGKKSYALIEGDGKFFSAEIVPI